jgi:ribosomal protein L32
MPEVQQIFQLYGTDYHLKHPLLTAQYKAMASITNCRTDKLGGHAEECESCGHIKISYNSCRNRHCPKCQTYLKEKWIDARREELLPVPYFHVVFTIPEELNMIAYQNQAIVYKILFDTVSQTIMELAADHKYLGAQIGLIAILHTWGQNLMHHPHLHCLVPSGGLNPSGGFVVGRKKFFIPVKVLSRLFCKKFMAVLKAAYTKKQLKFYGSIAKYADGQSFRRLVNQLYLKEWVVFCKETYSGPGAVIEYLGRYTNRVCISNNRILGVENGKVTFKWYDYRDKKEKVMTLTADEFIRRFLMHILPSGFMKIRYYGLWSNRNRGTKLKQCQQAVGYINTKARFKELCAVEIIKIITGKDVTLCPSCKKGKLRTTKTIAKGGAPPIAV